MEKSISAQNKVNIGVNDVESGEDKIKFICEFSHNHMLFRDLDENGKPKFHTDANGNNKTIDTFEIDFTPVSGHKNAEGKVDPKTAFCFYVADKVVLGDKFDVVVQKLIKDCKNPINKMYREDDHFKKRNPEAFRIASEKAALQSKIDDRDKAISDKDREINELKKQLFNKKKG